MTLWVVESFFYFEKYTNFTRHGMQGSLFLQQLSDLLLQRSEQMIDPAVSHCNPSEPPPSHFTSPLTQYLPLLIQDMAPPSSFDPLS